MARDATMSADARRSKTCYLLLSMVFVSECIVNNVWSTMSAQLDVTARSIKLSSCIVREDFDCFVLLCCS